MNINEYRAQADARNKLQERHAYLATLNDGQLLSLYHSLVQDMTLARYRNEIDRSETLYPDFCEVERMIHQRMAERRTVKSYEPKSL